MMNIFKNKIVIIGIVVVLLGFLSYQFMFKPDSQNDLYLASQNTFNPSDVIVGRDLLALLARMKTTKIDEQFFDNKIFKALEDFGMPIPDQPVKRINPFAPIGVEGTQVSSQTSETSGKPQSSAPTQSSETTSSSSGSTSGTSGSQTAGSGQSPAPSSGTTTNPPSSSSSSTTSGDSGSDFPEIPPDDFFF